MSQRTFNVYYNQAHRNSGLLVRPTQRHLAKSKATVVVRYDDGPTVQVATACYNPAHDEDNNSAGAGIAEGRLNSNRWNNLRLLKTTDGWEILQFENELGALDRHSVSTSLVHPCLTDAILCNIATRRRYSAMAGEPRRSIRPCNVTIQRVKKDDE